MTPNSIDFRAPDALVQTTRHRAPTRTSGENWGRSGGYYGDEDSSTSGYASSLLYVRKGLGSRDIVEAAIRFIRDVQHRATLRWTLVPLSHGWDGGLRHLGTDTPMRRNMPDDVMERLISDTCTMAGNDFDNGRTLITSLFPPTDIRSLYKGKTGVDRGDLLVFVDHAPPLFGWEPYETVQRLRRQVVLMAVSAGRDGAEWRHTEDFEHQEP